MNSIKVFFLVVVSGLFLASCGKTQYRKTKGGMPYQVFRGKDTQQIRPGDFIKLHITRKVNDSVYYTTTDALPAYLQVGQAQPYDISELWTSLRVGDSVIATQVMDTFIKRSPGSVNPRFGPGTKITHYIKIVDAFSNDSLAREDYEKGNQAYLPGEMKTIEKFLAEKNITAQKTPSGAFVQIINPGSGNLIDSGNQVSVNYTGKSWSGKTFDSNTDSAFQHVGPYSFVVNGGGMIKGFDEAMLLMRKGTVARVYIPSVLAYAGSPDSPLIKPYEILIFDIEVVNVNTAPPPPPPMVQPH
jgi:FKBP-type peptidyl-prolyl cis-trans isomerase